MFYKLTKSFSYFLYFICNSLQDEMFQKFNFDTEWAVRLISKITNDEDIPIEGETIVKQVIFLLMSMIIFCLFLFLQFFLIFVLLTHK